MRTFVITAFLISIVLKIQAQNIKTLGPNSFPRGISYCTSQFLPGIVPGVGAIWEVKLNPLNLNEIYARGNGLWRNLGSGWEAINQGLGKFTSQQYKLNFG